MIEFVDNFLKKAENSKEFAILADWLQEQDCPETDLINLLKRNETYDDFANRYFGNPFQLKFDRFLIKIMVGLSKQWHIYFFPHHKNFSLAKSQHTIPGWIPTFSRSHMHYKEVLEQFTPIDKMQYFLIFLAHRSHCYA